MLDNPNPGTPAEASGITFLRRLGAACPKHDSKPSTPSRH